MTLGNIPPAPAERRRTVRRMPHAGEPIAHVRLRAGRELAVLDVSSGGVLVEGLARLLPGTHVDVHIITPAGRILVRSRVSRAIVSMLAVDTVTYRGALIFDRGIDTSGYAIPGPPPPSAAPEGIDYPLPVADAATDAREPRSAQDGPRILPVASSLVTPEHPLASEVPCRS